MITDLIKMNDKLEATLRSLWAKPDEDKAVPSDLFYANTIPLRDFAIQNDLARFEFNMYDIPLEWSVDWVDGHMDVFMEVSIVALDRDLKIVSTIGGVQGGDIITIISSKAIVNGKEENIRNVDVSRGVYDVTKKAMGIWYGVQVALLHPTIKEVFSHPHTIKERIPKEERKNYGHKIYRYVKQHIISNDDVNTIIHGKFQRHALVWYVTGHWRKCKSGKITFIQGYWKGALRETKKADVRERELVV